MATKGKRETKKAPVFRDWDRYNWDIPYEKDSMVGTIFAGFCRKEGMKILKAKELILKLRKTKKGGNWVLADIRGGKFNGATWTFTEKNGVGFATGLKMPRRGDKAKKGKTPKKAKALKAPKPAKAVKPEKPATSETPEVAAA